jgi:hypothetical protein
MPNFIDSVFSHFEQRLKTQLYGVFAFWWVVLHGEFFYTLLFVDENKIYGKTGLLKNEYLHTHYFNYQRPGFWLGQLFLFAVAAFATYLMIWVIPKRLLTPAYRSERAYEFEKQKIRLEYEKEKGRLETAVEEQAAKTRQATEKKVKAEEQITLADPTVLWEEEFQQLKNRDIYNFFDELIQSLYEQHGLVNNGDFRLDRDVLAYADSNGLVDYDRSEGEITLTDKGKYFVKKYQAEQH